MKSEKGITLITVVIMVIIISIITAISIINTNSLIGESKEEVSKQNKVIVETMVSRYSAKAATSGVLTPANEVFPGIQNPSFESSTLGEDGIEIKENKSVGEDWYLLLEDELEEIGVKYVSENYLVNYKKNIVIPLSEGDNVFSLIDFYEKNN